jgi:hypothetical protein
MMRYATRIFIAKIIIISLAGIRTLNAMIPFTFIAMAFGFDQHRNWLDVWSIVYSGGEIRYLVL